MRINEEFVFEDKNGKVYEYTLRNDKNIEVNNSREADDESPEPLGIFPYINTLNPLEISKPWSLKVLITPLG